MHVSSRHRGFTLVELIVGIVILAVIGSSATSIIATAATSYSRATDLRKAKERVSHAADRLSREIREIEEDPNSPGTPDIQATSATGITFGSGLAIRLLNGDLVLDDPGQGRAVLCSGVTTFALTYLDATGATLNPGDGATPTQTRRIAYRIISDNFELHGLAAPRSGFGWR